ncbi:hypothetical protein TPB0596_01030 [Tsukamurella pulmonis]|uniref:DICT sensory domain-containing protein n=1 Tax=Tsukamurella pulmonis TaxID=47312 RepID=UPI001EE100D2|nr:DICT sensory domain-containing protein [Tsukamurella pulmonis]BDD80340.1 hypothetical protein TPB0596_01030 [Tsukamurella pulmonis]
MRLAPVRRLDDGVLAAVELQLRGARGGSLGSAQDLRRAVRMVDQKRDFDLLKAECTSDPLVDHVHRRIPVITTFDTPHVDESVDLLAPDRLIRVLASVPARAFTAAPHATIATIARAREQGTTICLEIGEDHDHSLALLSIVEPDVIITAPQLLRTPASAAAAKVVHSIAAHVERSHAVVIAEGVHDERARAVAETIGATYGIGDLYPALSVPDLLAEPVAPMPPTPVWTAPDVGTTTPFALATRNGIARRGTKHLLIEMSKTLEAQATSLGSPMVAVGTFQHARHFTVATAARWQAMGDEIGFAGVYGAGISVFRDGNVHRAPLDPDDPLVHEWTVAIVGPHFSALIAARDRHDNGPDLERTFDFVQTFDRTTVTQAIRSVLQRFP